MKTSPINVTAIVAGWIDSPEHPMVLGPRKFHAVDEFVEALAAAMGIAIPIVEGSLGDAPDRGYVIIFEEPALEEPLEIGPRVVLINADRASVRKSLERHQLVCAVEKHRYFQWRTDRAQEEGRWLYGRKDVAERMGATIGSGPPPTEHYGMIEESAEPDLPSLIARYLRAYDEL